MRTLIGGVILGVAFLVIPGAREQSPAIDEPYLADVPESCSYLTAALAAKLLRAGVRASQANEHIPTFWSQCIYTGQNVVGRQVHFTFKFMLHELTDVKTLDEAQLNFNVQFAASNIPPSERLKDLGKASFVFDGRNFSALMVITGIQGPLDATGRPTELIATYRLADPETPHPARWSQLLPFARQHLEEWLGRARPLSKP